MSLSQRAQHLIRIRKWAERYKPTLALLPRTRDNAVAQHLTLVGEFQNICKTLGLSAEQEWTEQSLVPLLFDYLFREFVSRPVVSLEALIKADSSTGLMHLIEDALTTQGGLANTVKAAKPE